MIASREEAARLLGKWFEEHTPVTALFTSGTLGFSAKVTGFVNGITSHILISDGPQTGGIKPRNHIVVADANASQYVYLEVKDLSLTEDEIAFLAATHKAGSLSIVFSNGDRLSVFETH